MKEKSELNCGVIAKSFPIVCGNLKIDQTEYVTFHGNGFELKRTKKGRYGVIAKKIN